MDPSRYDSDDLSGMISFIDASTFGFSYGDTESGEHIIDAQDVTTNLYNSTTMEGD